MVTEDEEDKCDCSSKFPAILILLASVECSFQANLVDSPFEIHEGGKANTMVLAKG